MIFLAAIVALVMALFVRLIAISFGMEKERVSRLTTIALLPFVSLVILFWIRELA